MLILDLRDHAFAKAPYILADESDRDGLSDDVKAEAARPLVGRRGGRHGVIDPDVLWSCTNCGACVNQCPVDIEHVDHIIDMRRYQVLVETNFPAELNQLFKGLENKGNPWNMSATMRMDWAKGLRLRGRRSSARTSSRWSRSTGCSGSAAPGAYEDRAKKTTRAVAELLNMAGISFGVLGNGETCTGDPARRAGNEFVFQGLAQQNVETLTEAKVKKVVSTCAHCFNTLKNEYRDFGLELEVRAPHPAAQPPRARGQADPGRRRRGRREALDHLPRPVLPRPAQPGLLARRASCSQVLPGADVRRDGAIRRTVLLLRRRRRAHVDGGEDRRADQREPHHRGRRHRRRPDRRRLPVLPGDARRRADRPAVAAARPARRSRSSTSRRCCSPRSRASAARPGPVTGAAAPAARRSLGGRAERASDVRPRRRGASRRPRRRRVHVAVRRRSPGTRDETSRGDAVRLAVRRPRRRRHPGTASVEPAPEAEPHRSRRGSLFDDGTSLFDTPPRRVDGLEPAPEPEPRRRRDRRARDSSAGGSLFDIAAPEPAPAARGRRAGTGAGAEPEAAPASRPSGARRPPDRASSSTSATRPADEDPDTILDADDEPPSRSRRRRPGRPAPKPSADPRRQTGVAIDEGTRSTCKPTASPTSRPSTSSGYTRSIC